MTKSIKSICAPIRLFLILMQEKMDAGQCDSKISYDYKYILLWQDITGKMEKRMQRVTIKDIASETGFSIATVSRALSKRGGVKDNTQEYIRETAINLSSSRIMPQWICP